ncbi:hypothetical protein FSP39_001405 [Pinctada imbricata]|uniref:Protein DP71L n=1 Tax=Pinctada imbricata TaxID=66713 RepID=A0AA89C4S1_PINIB|nr:hypothetical protein FSP39_001405 [Pinctada imbricata]
MENSQKKLKSNTFGCFKNFPVSKKRNRYNRYNWQLPPKADKSRVTDTPSDTTSNEKIQQSSVPKQKHTVRVCVKLQQGKSGSLGNKVKLQQAKSEPLESEKGLDAHITTQMGHLSLGEKVALENAKNTALKTSPESESEIDWFSMSRQNSEKELPSLSLMNCGDEDSDDNMCNISDEVRDLFSCCDSQSKPCDVVENRNDTDKKESDMKTSQSEQQVQLPGDISVKNMDRVTESAGSSHKNETIDSVESERSKMSIPMVLYVRDNKKARSSKKKRRKREKKSNVEQHAKNNTNFVGSDIDNKKRKFDIFSETYHSSSAGSSPMNVHSFLIAFNDEGANSSDGEIDWSDDDDGDDDECDADFLSVSSFTCPLSLNVICAVSRPESPKSSNTELEAVNSAWKINIQLNASPKKQCKSDKKVHFPSDDNLTQVHTAGDWCRKGQWEEFARDRMRFAQRIQDLESIISPVLQADHRQKIRNLLSK